MATGSITSDSTATPKIFSQNPVFDISGIATRPLRSKASSHAISHLDSRSDAARNQKRRNGGQNGDSRVVDHIRHSRLRYSNCRWIGPMAGSFRSPHATPVRNEHLVLA